MAVQFYSLNKIAAFLPVHKQMVLYVKLIVIVLDNFNVLDANVFVQDRASC